MVKLFGCTKQFCIIAAAYIFCVFLCKLNYGYHNQTHFIDIFQTKHFSAVKFAQGYEKNMSFLW